MNGGRHTYRPPLNAPQSDRQRMADWKPTIHGAKSNDPKRKTTVVNDETFILWLFLLHYPWQALRIYIPSILFRQEIQCFKQQFIFSLYLI